MKGRNLILAATSMLMLLAGSASPLAAELIVVDTLANELNTDGDCSLREAIVAANTDEPRDACPAGSGADLILVLLEGTITLPAFVGLPVITEGLTFAGNANLTIDGGNTAPIFQIQMENAAHDFLLEGNGMTLRRGTALGRPGGALWARKADRVEIHGVDFVENRACDLLVGGVCTGGGDSDGHGGAIALAADPSEFVVSLEITDSRFLRNRASERAGAVHAAHDAACAATAVTIERSIFLGNEAPEGYGGAGYLCSSGLMKIERSIFAANHAGSAGALVLQGAPGFALGASVRNSLVVDNFANGTGAATPAGGMLAIQLQLGLSFTTIARNRNLTGGIGGLYAVQTTVAASHVAITDHGEDDCLIETTNSLGFNLDSDGTCGFDDPDDLTPASTTLSGLGSFLGEELVALPSWWSPVVDGGNPLVNPFVEGGTAVCLDAAGNSVTVDLLGNPRAANGDGNGGAECDVGAIEVQPPYAFLFGDGFEAGGSWAWD